MSTSHRVGSHFPSRFECLRAQPSTKKGRMGVQMCWLMVLATFKLFLGHCGVCVEEKNDCSHSSFVFRLHPLPVCAAP